MEKIVFEKNARAIRHGNHVSNVDAEYCTMCGDNIKQANECGYNASPSNCPHTRTEYEPTLVIAEPKWEIGDLVTTGEARMGPGEIVLFRFHKDPETTHLKEFAIVHYPKYDSTSMPCYRTQGTSTLMAWGREPEPKKKPDPLLRQILNIMLKAWKEEGFTLEDL